MGLAERFRLLKLLSNMSRPMDFGSLSKLIVAERDCVSKAGLSYDRFAPAGGQWDKQVIAVHGVTINGKDDKRLQHFGRALAVSGTACIIPTLRGLSSFHWKPSDMDDLSSLALEFAATGKELGLVGFSYGGSYSLAAAASAALSGKIAFVLTFGAYHCLDALYKGYASGEDSCPEDDAEMDNWVYLRLLLAYKNAEQLQLAKELAERMESLLRRYCHESSLEEKRSFAKQYLENLDLIGVELKSLNHDELALLSPAGKMAGLKCRAGLLHDPNDKVVSCDHAAMLESELEAAGADFDVLVTGLISHVTPGSMLKLWQWPRLASILMPLVSADRSGRRGS